MAIVQFLCRISAPLESSTYATGLAFMTGRLHISARYQTVLLALQDLVLVGIKDHILKIQTFVD
jgi:hypothetical protein